MTSISFEERVRGSIFGLAYGDALAASAEFLSVEEILRRWPPSGPRELEGDPARITDDTQLGTAVGEALVSALSSRTVSVARVQSSLSEAFSAWFHCSDNTRSPGLTCLSAAARLSQGHPWTQSTIVHSKGCGANMRVTPVGLLRLPDNLETSAGAPLTHSSLAQMQAAMTHGHPTALAAADLTAHALRHLVEGGSPEELPIALRAYAESQRMIYQSAWLGDLWQESHGSDSEQSFIARGWAECIACLDRLDAALRAPDSLSDPCDLTGSGWVAEELLATSLYCFVRHSEDPVAALNRAAVTRGDSDSIAAVCGAMIGAHLGFGAWPSSWYTRIETAERLEVLAGRLCALGG